MDSCGQVLTQVDFQRTGLEQRQTFAGEGLAVVHPRRRLNNDVMI